MAATLEINYFNSFWIKKMDSIAQVKPTTAEIASDATSATQTVTEAIPVSYTHLTLPTSDLV